MKPLAFVDIESRSYSDLASEGFDQYVRDPSTVPVSVVAIADNACFVWVNASLYTGRDAMPLGEIDIPTRYGDAGDVRIDFTPDVPAWLYRLSRTRTFVGHNADGFDAPFMQRVLNIDAEWLDTLPLARQAGLPGGLDKIGERLLGVGKHAGHAILRRFYDANKAAPYHLLWALVSYNVCDCLITRQLYREVEEFTADAEHDVIALHHKINARGVGLDRDLRGWLTELSITAKERAGEEIERLTSGRLKRTDLRSVPKMKAWLGENGFVVDNMRRETINKLLGDPDAYFVGDAELGITLQSVMPVVPRVLRLRSAATRNTEAKLDKMDNRADLDDHRLRGLLVYYGAHTGRFSSRIVQLHNMHRGVPKCDVQGVIRQLTDAATRYIGEDEDAERKAAHYDIVTAEADRLRTQHGMAWVAVDDVIGTLLRYVLVPTPGRLLGIVDYAAIEARGAAWIADETKLLDIYRVNGDPYCDFGSVLFGRPITKKDEAERFVSKVIILGSQYGLGAEKLAMFAANNGIDFHAVGVTAEQCIQTYRTTYPRIQAVWYELADAVREAVDNPGMVYEAGRCAFAMCGPHLICQLPSGRELCYRNARVEDVLMRWGETRPAVTYDHHHGYRKQFWHGLITENCVQALCRDLLCGAMLRLDKLGLDIVLHVHDEIVAELDDAAQLHDMEREMRASEAWSEGFPIEVEGHVSTRYGKIALV